jgi:hypothetical protein
MKKIFSFLKFMARKLASQLGVTTQNLYQASGVSSTVGQKIVGNAKPVQGVNQVCVVKSSNVDYFQDAATITSPPGVTTGNVSGGITIPATSGGSGTLGIPAVGDIYKVMPIPAGTLVLTAWLEIVTPSLSTTWTVNMGFTSNPVSSAALYGTNLDLVGNAAGVIVAGANSASVPVVSPIMCATDTTIDLITSGTYTAGASASSPIVIVYALVVDLNF